MLINASSATIAIVIGLSAKGVLNFDMAAALTLGANIGTTFDSFLVSIGTNANARRSAWSNILFNVLQTLFVLAAFRPFLQVVDWVTPRRDQHRDHGRLHRHGPYALQRRHGRDSVALRPVLRAASGVADQGQEVGP
jgi:hypothetical protein